MSEKKSQLSRNAFLIISFGIIALNINSALATLSPVISEIADGYGVTIATCGMLSTIALLAYAVGAPLVTLLTRVMDTENILTVGLFALLLGEVLRIVPNYPIAVVAFCLMGFGVIDLLMMIPSLVVRDFKESAGTITSYYSTIMNVAACLATALSVPIASCMGWQGNFAIWAGIVLLTLVWWLCCLKRIKGTAGAENNTASDSNNSAAGTQSKPKFSDIIKRPSTWLITFLFAFNALCFFSFTIWLPTILTSTANFDSAQAGLLASVFQVSCIIGSFACPFMLKTIKYTPTVLVFTVLFALMPFGLLVMPGFATFWIVCGGAGQGGVFVYVLTLIALVSKTEAETPYITLIMYVLGYVVGAFGPFAIGTIGSSTVSSAGWLMALGVILGANVLAIIFGFLATKASQEETSFSSKVDVKEI